MRSRITFEEDLRKHFKVVRCRHQTLDRKCGPGSSHSLKLHMLRLEVKFEERKDLFLFSS